MILNFLHQLQQWSQFYSICKDSRMSLKSIPHSSKIFSIEGRVLRSSQERSKTDSASRCPFKTCFSECFCTEFSDQFVPNSAQIIHSGIIVNSPNCPGLRMRESTISYGQIDGISILEITKLKLCFKDDLILMATLQIYRKHNEDKPICIGLDKVESLPWFLRSIQAKLAVEHSFKMAESCDIFPKATGYLYKKSAFGKWKIHKASFNASHPKCLKLEDELTGINSTSEIWTRFEFLHEGVPCLVMKLWGALGKKELAIPLPQLTMWLTALCSLLG